MIMFATVASGKCFNLDNGLNGDIQYRLKMVDNDGTFTYSDVLNFRISAAIKATVSPNPATSVIKVQFATATGAKTVKIVDNNGKAVKQLRSTSIVTTINVDDLPRGIYMVQIQDGAKLDVQKLILQ